MGHAARWLAHGDGITEIDAGVDGAVRRHERSRCRRARCRGTPGGSPPPRWRRAPRRRGRAACRWRCGRSPSGRVDRHDLGAIVGVVASSTSTLRPARSPAAAASVPLSTAADDDEIGVDPPHVDGRRLRADRHVGLGHRRHRRPADGRVAADDEPRPGRRLAGAHVGHAVDLGHAVRAVAGEAQRAAVVRMLTVAEDRQRDRVALLVVDRCPVDDDAPRPVMRASSCRQGRTPARAAAGPGGGGR